MTPCSGRPVRSASGASNLVVLLALLGAFVVMHGIAATRAAGVHHSPVVLVAAAVEHGTHEVADPSPPAPEDSGAAHGLMVGCVFVLSGALAVVALRTSRTLKRTGNGTAALPATGRFAPRPARPPSRCSSIALCVMRV